MTTDSMTPADLAAVTGSNEGFGGNGAWWIIILFLFAFMGNGWGNNNSGAADNYVLASDFATLQRQISDTTNSLERKLDNQNAGICDLGYTQAQLINQNNISQLQGTNAIQSQLASCCCDVREAISGINYNMAMNSNTLQNAITSGFCQTNFNNQTNTRDIIANQDANARAILEAIQANKVEALKDRIAEQNQQINALQLSASQAAQNAYLIDQLGAKVPIPAYLSYNPNATCSGCGCA